MLGPITAKDAVEFVKRWHYAASATSGVVRYGWWDGPILMGASIFDLGNHHMRQGVFGPESFSHVLHHQRLAMRPDAPHGTTSTFLAACLRQLKGDRPDVWAVVTYADASQKHVGTIYQACNALYTGVTTKGNLYFRKPDGSIGTMQSLKRYQGQSLTWPERRRVAEELGWEERRSPGKHRYVFLLKKKKIRDGKLLVRVESGRWVPMLWETLPYPKKILVEAA